MRVSLIVGAVVAACVVSAGAAVAAPGAKGGCAVKAKVDTPIVDAKTLKKDVGVLKAGQKKASACRAEDHPLAGRVVYLNNRKWIVGYKAVTIVR